MRLKELEKYGIPERIIDIWRERQGDSLLPVQSKAVRKGLLGECYNNRYQPVSMLIAAPTSSGKSFCAEMAAMRSLALRKKVVMLFPLKSLAEQKYQLFHRTYSGSGIKCLIATGDHPENDKAFAEGDYQIAVVIYEKFDQLLTSSMDSLKNIGLVLVDEIQSISEPGRGAVLERLLTKILASVYRPSLVGLSAVIGDSANNVPSSAVRLAEWMKAVMVEESLRPVDLIRGVAVDGVFSYRSYNNHLDGSESFLPIEPGDDLFDAFVKQISHTEGQTLIFLKSRMDTVNCAFKLASSINWGEACLAIEKLSEEEPSFLTRSLRQIMSRGVAFHNSDLSQSQRKIVENAFVNKEIRVIVSTTTLAMGVNLPVDTVYLETVKYVPGEYNNQPSLIPVSRSEFENMTGRAGRLQADCSAKPGRAVVLAESSFDRDVLWDNYIADSQPEQLGSAFLSVPLVDWVLNMLVTKLADSAESLVNLYRQTLQAMLDEKNSFGPFDFDEAVQLLIDHNLVKAEKADYGVVVLLPTNFGEKATKAGLSVRETVYYLKKLKAGCPDSLAGWVSLALSGPGWSLPPAVLSRMEFANQEPLKLLYRYYDHLLGDVSRLSSRSLEKEPLTYRGAASLKSVLMLHDWCALTPVQKIEERFQIHLGQILSLGETAAYLVTALGCLAEGLGKDFSDEADLKRYAFSLRRGMPFKWYEWDRCSKGILNRADYLAFERAGIDKLSQLCLISHEDLKEIIACDSKIKRVSEIVNLIKEEVQVRTSSLNQGAELKSGGMVLFGKPELIEIDGSYERERYLVKINGFPVWLTGKSFKYFTKLACARFSGGSGWVYKEDIEIGFNQARYLYRMKNEINDALSSDWQIIENNRLGYYRLNIDPSKIKINFNNLKDHPDYELQTLAIDQAEKKRPAGFTIAPTPLTDTDNLRGNVGL